MNALRDVFRLVLSERSDLMIAEAKIFELLPRSTTLLEARQNTGKKAVEFFERVLAMFAIPAFRRKSLVSWLVRAASFPGARQSR